jgi:hypothetical protein
LNYAKRLHDRIAALPLLLPAGLRGYFRALYKAIVPQSSFSLDEVIRWLSALRDAGVVFGFPDDVPGANTAGETPIAILKHDIHDDLDRAVQMAHAEHANGIHGLYFMMGPHALNRKFYGTARAWDQLRTIQRLGHRVGLHLDTFDALKRGGIYAFAASTTAAFAREGIVLRYGNCHGDRKYEALGISVTDFFVEIAGKRTAASNLASGKMAPHFGKYALKELAGRYGLEYWVEGRVLRAGVRLERALYVTDNTGCIRIAARGLSSKPFRIDEEFIAASAAAMVGTHSIILLHPQWYASRNSKT